MEPIKIYIDGACSGNPGPGGWAVIFYYKDKEKELYGSAPNTTNNRMELTAAIKALETFKKTSTIIIYTDSQYVQVGITKWLHNWKLKNWKNSNNKTIKNLDLWQQLDKLIQQHNIKWIWVEAHSGIKGNERADTLARNAIISSMMNLN